MGISLVWWFNNDLHWMILLSGLRNKLWCRNAPIHSNKLSTWSVHFAHPILDHSTMTKKINVLRFKIQPFTNQSPNFAHLWVANEPPWLSAPGTWETGSLAFAAIAPVPLQRGGFGVGHGSTSNWWLVVYLPLWKIWVRQLGWLFPIYSGK